MRIKTWSDQTQRLTAMLAAAVIILAFFALNYQAFDSYFQDDEFDNMSWTPLNASSDYVWGILSPRFSVSNFRPIGALYFRWMTRAAGSNFASWVPSLFAIHLLNGALLLLLLRKIRLAGWSAWLGCAFFVLSGAAMDAYWKPMYVFDLLCTTLCLASVLLYAHRRWVLSFIAFWLAYKSKELAVMLPAVLALYEYWLGERRYLRLIPFLAVSLSFGIQGILFNPNKNNDYTFRFSLNALKLTVPYYVHRFMGFRGSGLLLAPILLIRDRRIWFGMAGAGAILSLLLFLPGRRFEAYAYLPMACLAVAIAAAAARHPRVVWSLFALWLPWNAWVLHREQRETLTAADDIASFAIPLERFARQHPDIRTLVWEGQPATFHHWGVTAIWNYGHRTVGLPTFYANSNGVQEAMETQTVALARWNPESKRMTIVLEEAAPERAVPAQSSAQPRRDGR